MNGSDAFETLEHAAAHLLLMAENAPPETAEEMREIAARLQALCYSPYFERRRAADALQPEESPAG